MNSPTATTKDPEAGIAARPAGNPTTMQKALEPTQDSGWFLRYDGYNVLEESALESRFALSNGFLGMRAARSVSRGPTWVSWLGYSRWASWPRCYVAGLFDVPNTEPPVPALVPVADWSRVRILLDGEPLLAREGEVLLGTRTLDMRRGVLFSAWTHRTPAGITASGRELRLLSLADRTAGLQLLRFSLDRDGVDVRLDASFAMAGLGMEPTRLEQDIGAWRTEGTSKGVAMAGSARLRLNGDELAPDRPFSLRWSWRWRSVAGQVAELDRLIAVARADAPQDDPVPVANAALARSRALGWRTVLDAHENAWNARWNAGEIVIEGDDESQQALRFALYHLTAANPEDERVSIGARALTGDAYRGHVFWDTEIFMLPFSLSLAGGGAGTADVPLSTLDAARARRRRGCGWRGALYAWESADTGDECTPERWCCPTFGRVIACSPAGWSTTSAPTSPRQCGNTGARPATMFSSFDAGAEILLETARFWASRATPTKTGAHIAHVIGPDEYHEGIDDNAFTNWMARWNIARALEALDLLHARWPDEAAALRESWRSATTSLLTGATSVARIVDRPRSERPVSMSSSPASTGSNRSTSPHMPTAPCRWMWCSAASARSVRRLSSRRTLWRLWRCCRKNSPERWQKRISAITSRSAHTAVL